MYLNLVLTILLSGNTFQESSLYPINIEKSQISTSVSFSKSKKFLQKIYLKFKNNLTFYCGRMNQVRTIVQSYYLVVFMHTRTGWDVTL